MAEQPQQAPQKEARQKVVAVSKSQHGHFRAGQFWRADGASYANLTAKQIGELKADKLIVIVEADPPSTAEVLAAKKKGDAEEAALLKAKMEKLEAAAKR